MSTGDFPMVANSVYGATNSSYALGSTTAIALPITKTGLADRWAQIADPDWKDKVKLAFINKRDIEDLKQFMNPNEEGTMAQTLMPAVPTRRIVQVFIVDPDKRVPLHKCLLYQGDQRLTDATDQELFFEVEIKSLLDSHNTYRETCRDEDASIRAGKDIFLKPTKIRDLIMHVVTVAGF